MMMLVSSSKTDRELSEEKSYFSTSHQETLSVAYFGLFVLTNSMLVSNFLVVKTLRDIVERTQKLKLPPTQDEKNFKGANTWPEKIILGIIAIALLPAYIILLPAGLIKWLQERKAAKKDQTNVRSLPKTVFEATAAFLIGYTGKEEYEEKPFKDYRKLPYKMGVWSTAGLVCLFTFLFSDNVLQAFGIPPLGFSSICSEEAQNEILQKMRSSLLEATNFRDARAQHELTLQMQNAIQQDNALFGEPDFQGKSYLCTGNPPYSKKEFYALKNFSGRSFYPDQCLAARDMALEFAKSQTCTTAVCPIATMIDPSTIEVSAPVISDIWCDNCENVMRTAGKYLWKKGFCIFSKCNWGDVAGEFRFGVDGTKGNITYETMEVELCQYITHACPDYAKTDELEGLMDDVYTQQLRQAQDSRLATSINATGYTGNVTTRDSTSDVVTQMIYEIEIASYIYVGYSLLGLFFPIPLFVFRPARVYGARGLLFGLNQKQFMIAVLFIWWFHDYLKTYNIFDEFNLYITTLLEQPCLADPDFMQRLSTEFTATCAHLVEMESEWGIANATIDNMLTMTIPFTTCCRQYPYVHLAPVMTRVATTDFEGIGFSLFEANPNFNPDTPTNRDWNDLMCLSEACYLPHKDSAFVGNFTICDDSDWIREEIFGLKDEDMKSSWVDVWLKSGILSSLLLKATITTFAIALLRLADPLMTCNGRYFFPPKYYEFTDVRADTIRGLKESALKRWGIGSVFVSGLMMNLMMVNVYIASRTSETAGGVEAFEGVAEDTQKGLTLMLASFVPLGLTFIATKLVLHQVTVMERVSKTM